MSLRTISRNLQFAVLAATVATSLCPFYFAFFIMRLYHDHHPQMSWMFSMGQSGVLTGTLYLVAAALYLFAPRLHPVLQVLTAMLACISVERAFGYWSLLHDRNMFHNILAEPMWEMFGRVVMACLCMAHFAVELEQRKNNSHRGHV
jgi:hypothetical protein